MKQINKSIKSNLKKYKKLYISLPFESSNPAFDLDEEEMETLLEKIPISSLYQNSYFRLQYTEISKILEEWIKGERWIDGKNFHLYYAGILFWLRFKIIRNPQGLPKIFISKKELVAYQVVEVFSEPIIKQMMHIRGYFKTMEEYEENS